MSRDPYRDRFRRVAIAVLTVAMVVSQPAAVVSVTADDTASLTVDVRIDGERADEVNSLIIYRDDWSEPYRKIENYDSVDLEHVFSDLPGGHDYLVSAYIQDQSAGNTGWIGLDGGESVERDIDAEERNPLTVRALHDDESTPLEDARMTIESHESYTWRSGTTGGGGYARTSSGGDDFYLYPPGDAGYYTVEIRHDGEVVGSQRIDTLDRGDSIEVETSVPVTHDLSVSSTEGGDIDADQTGSIEAGTEVDLEADPDPNYAFDEWEGDVPAGVSETDDEITVAMDEDRDLEAEFIGKTEVTFTVSKESTIPGYGFSGEPIEDAELTVDGVTRFTGDDGKEQFRLAPGEHEYTVTADGFESLTDTTNVPETGGITVGVGLVRDGAGGLTVDVVDRDGNSVGANKYQVFADGERLDLNAESEAILDAGTYDIEVKPTSSGSDELTEVSKTVTVEAGEGTEVEFTPVEVPTYSLEVENSGEGGTVYVSPPDKTVADSFSEKYEEGTEVTIEAQPVSGYTFEQWTGDAGDIGRNKKSVTITVDEEHSISPVFKLSSSESSKSLNIDRVDVVTSNKVNKLGNPAANDIIYPDSDELISITNTSSNVSCEYGRDELCREITVGSEVNTEIPALIATNPITPPGDVPSVYYAQAGGFGTISYISDYTADSRGNKNVTVEYTIDSLNAEAGTHETPLIPPPGGAVSEVRAGHDVYADIRVYDPESNEVVVSRKETISKKSTPDLAKDLIIESAMVTLGSGLSSLAGRLSNKLIDAGYPVAARMVDEVGSDTAEFFVGELIPEDNINISEKNQNRKLSVNFDAEKGKRYLVQLRVRPSSATQSQYFAKGHSNVTIRTAANTFSVTSVEGEDSDAWAKSEDPTPNDANSDNEWVKDGVKSETKEDTDNNGVPNYADPDNDGDGYDDGVEAAAGTDPNDPTDFPVTDTDGDGLSDSKEKSLGTDPERADTDGDGFDDFTEYNQGTDPLDPQDHPPEDSDRDGVPDSKEVEIGTDPQEADTDGDGLSDGAELNIGTSPTAADSDGDGYNDSSELEAGSDPSDPQSTPESSPTALLEIESLSLSANALETEETVTFEATIADVEDSQVSYGWDFDGDGSIETTTERPTVDYTYKTKGIYEAELIAIDDTGNRDTVTRTIQVTAEDPDETILRTNFESTPVGQYPSEWTKVGNRNQEVVDSPAASGDQALQLSGSHGGCWEAIADRETELPDSGTAEISFSIRPTTNGELGCHDDNGAVRLNTETGSWSAGSGYGVIEFTPDGTVSGSGTDLGSYQVDAWNDVTIRYARSGDEVTLTYFLNGERRGTTTRDARSFEDALSYLRVKSGDFTMQIDDLEIERVDRDPDADDPGDEYFVDGEYRDRWNPTAESDETIRVEDEHLIHDSPATDTPDANLLGENYYEAEGTVTISVRQRQADTNYWRSGFGLVFDETTIELAEHERGANDSLTLFAGGETDLASATDSTDWQRYNITVNFDTMTVESVTRGGEVYEVDADLPAIEDDTFQLTLGTGPGHDTRYDFVGVRGTDPVGSVPPDAAFDATTTTPARGESVTFDASPTTDPDSPIEHYEWDFDGDGIVDATTTDPTVTHTYDEAGEYDAELIAVDTDDDRDEFDRTIAVTDSDTPDSGDGSSGSATGDPHLTTFDGVSYDFQAAGEFVLARDPDGSLAVQARLRPVSDRQVSVISAVATRVDGQNVTVDAEDSDVLTVDGTPRSLAPGESLSVGDGRISRTGETYTIVYPGANDQVDDGDERVDVTVRRNRVDTTLTLEEGQSDIEGLLGSPDGNASNDIAYANGTTLSQPVPFETLYGQYRDDYRVTAATSLFDYDAGESPSTFFDPDYPSRKVSVADLDDRTRERAREQALDAGLEPGTPEFTDAVLDFGLTDDESYIESAERAANETNATVEATPAANLQFDDSAVANGTETIPIDRVTYTGGAHYVVVYTEASPGDGTSEPGVRVGRSPELESGTSEDVPANLSRQLSVDDDLAELQSNRTLVARLHRANGGGVGSPIEGGRDTASVTVRDKRLTITSPTDEYIVGDEVTVNGTATTAIDGVVLYARNGSDNRYVGLRLEGPRERSPTRLGVTDSGRFEAEDVLLALGNDPFATYGPTEIAAVPASDAIEYGAPGPTPATTLPSSYVESVTDATAAVEAKPPRLNVTVRDVGGEVAVEDSDFGIDGTATGHNVVGVVLVGSNGATVIETVAVTDAGRVREDDVVVTGGSDRIPTGPVEVFVLAPGRDGAFGDGRFPDVDDRRPGPGFDALEVFLASLDTDSAAEVESALRNQTIEDDGPEVPGAPFPTDESDDLLDAGSFRLADAETTITRIAPAGSGATGVTPVEPGSTAVIEGETNLRPGDNTITLELHDADGTTVRSIRIREWSTNGTFTARLDTAGLSAGSYSLVADDRYALSTTPVTIGERTTDSLVVAPGTDGDYSSIQAAVDNASAGATVEVRPGTYRETIDVTKSITLVASDGATLDGGVTPDRTFPVAPNRSAAAIEIGDGASPTIEGFTIRNYDAAALYAFGTTEDWTLRNTTIHDTTIGVGASGSDGAWRLNGVRVRNVTSSIYADDSTGAFAVRDTVLRSSRIALVTTNATGDWALRNATIRNTNGTAVYAANTTGKWSIHGSTIADNDRGINATSAGLAGNASRNWWGDSSGPSGAFAGTGDTVVGNVSVNPYYTDAALTTTATVPAPSPGPANLTVTPPSLPANVTVDTTLNTSVTVTNVGGQNTTQSVEFRLDVDRDGTLENTSVERQDRTTVTLAGGEHRTLRFETYTGGLSPGTYRYGIVTPNDSRTGVVNVTQPPSAAAAIEFDDSTVANGTRTVTVDRANYTGGQYYVVIHQSAGDGEIGRATALGNSSELSSGEHTDLSVDLEPFAGTGDDVDALTRDRSLVAVIHRTDPGANTFNGIVTSNGTAVADTATIEVQDVSQVTVGPPGSGATFTSLDHAIDSVPEDGTIILRSGTYDTQLRLDRNVTVTAPDGATFDGANVDGVVTSGVIIGDDASPTVTGVTVQNYDWGVSASNTSGDWTLRNATLRNNTLGVKAAGSTGAWRIVDTTIRGHSNEGVYARETTGDWRIEGALIRDTADTGVDATRSDGDWVVESTNIHDSLGPAIEARQSDGAWLVRSSSIRNSTQGIDAANSRGDWAVRDTGLRSNTLHAVVAADTTGDWTVVNATLVANYRGVNATRSTGTWTITASSFENNGLAVDARGAGIAGSAPKNWWNAADGPGGLFGGSGDAVRGTLLVRPFYTDAQQDSLSAPVRASITFENTTVRPDTETVTVDRANYTGQPYVVVVYRDAAPEDTRRDSSVPVGVSSTLSAGAHTDIPVHIDTTLSGNDTLDSLDENTSLTARIHRTGRSGSAYGVPVDRANATARVSVELPPATVEAENRTAMSNTTVRVPIRALNATAVTDFTANVSYDPTVANVTGVTASGADDATVTVDNDTGTLRFQHQYSERDTPVVNVTFDVDATNDTSTQLAIEQATVDTAGSRDPSVATGAGRLTIFESAVRVTNTTLNVTTSRPDEPVVVSATVTNPTPIAGEFAVPLHVNQSQEAVRNVTLAANETTTLQFTYTPTEAGTWPVTVGSGTVQTLAVEEVTIDETNTTTVIETRAAPETPLNSSLAGTNGTTDDGVSLNQLNVSTTRETNISVEVNVSADSSDAPPLGDAAAYLNISESMPEDAIGTVTFEFTVDTDQLSDPDSAELYRYHDGTWNALETTYLGERNGEFRFRSISPGLSIFAVGQPATTVDTDDDGGSNDAIGPDDDSESTPASTPAPTTPSTPGVSTATPGSTDEATTSPETPSDDTQTSEPPAAVETSRPATTPTEPGGFSSLRFIIVLVLLVGGIAMTAFLRRRDRL